VRVKIKGDNYESYRAYKAETSITLAEIALEGEVDPWNLV